MTPDLGIRAATTDDISSLLDLYDHLSPGDRCDLNVARQALSQLTEIPGSAILVGELLGELVTTCTLVIVPNLTRGGRPYAIVENVVTHPACRAKGFATAILDAATNQAWDHGCYKIMLSTGSQRPEILAFYERTGFTQSRTGFQKRRLPARAEVASI